jgi:hypothetical protein
MTSSPSTPSTLSLVWWRLAQEDHSKAARAWSRLPQPEQKRIRHAAKRASRRHGLLDIDLRKMGDRVSRVLEEIDAVELILTWSDGIPLSDHLRLEVAAVWHWGRSLRPKESVPGCTCTDCAGPAPLWQRRLALRRAASRSERSEDAERSQEWERAKERAKGTSIVHVAHMLGLGEPEERGKQMLVKCPFHNDESPSLSLDPQKGLWYCFPCSRGGDGLSLYMETRKVSFREAVEALSE